jgi:hypothetical protein
VKIPGVIGLVAMVVVPGQEVIVTGVAPGQEVTVAGAVPDQEVIVVEVVQGQEVIVAEVVQGREVIVVEAVQDQGIVTGVAQGAAAQEGASSEVGDLGVILEGIDTEIEGVRGADTGDMITAIEGVHVIVATEFVVQGRLIHPLAVVVYNVPILDVHALRLVAVADKGYVHSLPVQSTISTSCHHLEAVVFLLTRMATRDLRIRM